MRGRLEPLLVDTPFLRIPAAGATDIRMGRRVDSAMAMSKIGDWKMGDCAYIIVLSNFGVVSNRIGAIPAEKKFRRKCQEFMATMPTVYDEGPSLKCKSLMQYAGMRDTPKIGGLSRFLCNLAG